MTLLGISLELFAIIILLAVIVVKFDYVIKLLMILNYGNEK